MALGLPLELSGDFAVSAASLVGPRRRRVRDETGQWVDARAAQGCAIDHRADLEGANEPADAAPSGIEQRRQRRAGRGTGEPARGDDPFRLVVCRRYGGDATAAPFGVTIESNALLVMDVHAHAAMTEVIGLLGGTYDATERQLLVLQAFPCNSFSTGLQCEMDPVSEARTRDELARRNLAVVGWYHSHPVFDANPSVRDIETQSLYQALFRRPDGAEPFIGIIISPYNPLRLADESAVQCVHVSRDPLEPGSPMCAPYLCEPTVRASGAPGAELRAEVARVLGMYRTYPHRAELLLPYRPGEPTTRLAKLLRSLSANIRAGDAEREAFLADIRALAAAPPASDAIA